MLDFAAKMAQFYENGATFWHQFEHSSVDITYWPNKISNSNLKTVLT